MTKMMRIHVQPISPDLNSSRFRNFGEDVWCYCRDTGHAELSLEAVDDSVDTLILRGIRSRMCRRVQHDLLEVVKLHYFSGEFVTIEPTDRVDDDPTTN